MLNVTSRRRHENAYRRLVRLYPRGLREDHGDEMAQVFDDLLRDGGRRAWGRVSVDLAVSLPRTRMEVLMSTRWSRAALLWIVTMAAAGAVVGTFAVGSAAFPFAAVLVLAVIAQRSRLARAVDGGPSSPRRAALAVLIIAASIFAAAVVSWFVTIARGGDFTDTTLLAYNAVGLGSLAGLLASAFILTRRSHARR